MAEIELLRQMDLFWGMNDGELQLICDIASVHNYEPEEVIFQEGDDSNQLYIISKGSVEIYTEVADGVLQTLSELHHGTEFGEMALISDEPRSANAKALKPTELLCVLRDDFLDLVEREPTFSAKILINFARTLSQRLRSTNQVLRQTMDWNVKIGGASALNIGNLIKEGNPVRIHLHGNTELKGLLLKVEQSGLGHEITLQDESDQIYIIPYHSILYIHVEHTHTTLPLSWQ